MWGKGDHDILHNDYYICVCVGRSDQVFTLFNMTCLCVGMGDQAPAQNNTEAE